MAHGPFGPTRRGDAPQSVKETGVQDEEDAGVHAVMLEGSASGIEIPQTPLSSSFGSVAVAWASQGVIFRSCCGGAPPHTIGRESTPSVAADGSHAASHEEAEAVGMALGSMTSVSGKERTEGVQGSPKRGTGEEACFSSRGAPASPGTASSARPFPIVSTTKREPIPTPAVEGSTSCTASSDAPCFAI